VEIGTTVADRYELVGLLGRGGMGEVWKGFDQRLDRHVAIKVLRGDAFHGDEQLAQAEHRLRREARATARLQHPGVPIVYDVGVHDGRLFLVMQLVSGLTLDDLIAEHDGLPVSWAAAIGAQICAVLTVAHAESLIHRDLKPSNLMLGPDGTIKVLDFGIVAITDPSLETSKITLVGEAIGTPAYLAPEYATTGVASPQSDLYALGCILHELLAGTKVFPATMPLALFAQHSHADPAPLRTLRPEVPEELEQLVLWLLRKLPADRPHFAAEVYTALLPHVHTLPPLPGATAAAPSPDPMRMYATVVGRIAETALTGPAVPAGAARTPAPAQGRQISGGADVRQVLREADELAEAGRLSQAIELLRGALARDATHTDPRLELGLRHQLAGALFLHRDYAAALPELRDVAQLLADEAGPDHELVLDLRLKEASALAAVGRTREALERLLGLMPDFERTLGATDPHTLNLREEICRLLALTGQLRAARSLAAALLIDVRDHYGDGHSRTRAVQGLLDKLEQAAG
jgi:eukaryotic-like serine/threonine-protein kinase